MDQARDPRKRSTRGRECEPPLPEPLAYFLTWPTYGTWLPGDERGWVEYCQGWQLPDPARKREAQARMTEDACLLNQEQRQLVESTIADHCRVREWTLYAVNCRSNHVHVIVAGNREPKECAGNNFPVFPKYVIKPSAWSQTGRRAAWTPMHRKSNGR